MMKLFKKIGYAIFLTVAIILAPIALLITKILYNLDKINYNDNDNYSTIFGIATIVEFILAAIIGVGFALNEDSKRREQTAQCQQLINIYSQLSSKEDKEKFMNRISTECTTK